MKSKILIGSIVLIIIAAVVAFFFIRSSDFKVISVDKATRTVTFEFFGQTHTFVFGDQNVGWAGKFGYMLTVRNVNAKASAPGVELELSRKGRTIRQENIWF
jgi:hypothetical protein